MGRCVCSNRARNVTQWNRPCGAPLLLNHDETWSPDCWESAYESVRQVVAAYPFVPSLAVTCLRSSLRLNVWCVTCEVQSWKPVDDDLNMGVVILGIHNSRAKEHLIPTLHGWTLGSRRETKMLEIARTQQYINSQPAPMQLEATPKGKGKVRRKEKPKQLHRQRHSHCNPNRQPSKPKGKGQ